MSWSWGTRVAAKGDRLIAETKHATSRDQTLWSQGSGPGRSHWVYYTLQHRRSNTQTHKALPRGLPWCSGRTIIICIQYGCDASAGSVSTPVSSAHRPRASVARCLQRILFIVYRSHNFGGIHFNISFLIWKRNKTTQVGEDSIWWDWAKTRSWGDKMTVWHDYLFFVDGIFIIK